MIFRIKYKIKKRIDVFLLVLTFAFSFSALFWETRYISTTQIKNQDVIRRDLIDTYAKDRLILEEKQDEILSDYLESIDHLIDQKRNSLQIHSDDCFCVDGRKNWIHYNMCQGKDQLDGAGIKDRENILRNLMWYADEICAKIAIDCLPRDWLAKSHGCSSPEHANWDVYFTPIRKNSIQKPVSKVDVLHWNINKTDAFRGLRRVNDGSVEKYEMARKLHQANIPFVWKFNKSFWDTDLYDPKHVWPNQIFSHRPYSPSCGILDFDASNDLLNVGELLLHELNVTSRQEYVTIHLRRGDYMNCDTEPTSIMNYLNCSIADDDVQKIVVLTNGNYDYQNNLSQMFKESFPTKEMIMLDQVITSASFLEKLSEEQVLSVHSKDDFLNDNCFRFSAEKVIVSFARYHLERGHGYCKGSCDRGGSVKKNGAAMLR
jgi:hypothetical protein